MIRCLDEIGEQLRRGLGLSMTAAQIESVLRGESGSMDERARGIIQREADSYVARLLSAIQAEAARQEIQQDILLEVNVGGEASKSGFAPEAIMEAVEAVAKSPNIRLRGLMTIPPVCQNSGDNDKFFQEMCRLRVDITAKKYDNVCADILSMGMSDDYVDAIRCGSTMIRVGTAIFGPRDYSKSHQA